MIRHAEMRINDAFIELSLAGGEYKSPKQLGGVSGLIIVFIDNVDEHYKKALAGGAHSIALPEGQAVGFAPIYSGRSPGTSV